MKMYEGAPIKKPTKKVKGFKRAGRKYHSGTIVPESANLNAFNAGYYLGISLGEYDPINLIASFKCGLVNGVQYRYQTDRTKIGKLLGISTLTVKNWLEMAQKSIKT